MGEAKAQPRLLATRLSRPVSASLRAGPHSPAPPLQGGIDPPFACHNLPMTLDLDRRLLLKAGTLGLGALAVPGVAQIAAARGFTHGVASGEPGQRSVMLWTRYVPRRRPGSRLAGLAHAGFPNRIVAEGDVVADGRARLLRQAVSPTGPRARPLVSLPLPRPRGAVSPRRAGPAPCPEGRTAALHPRHLLLRQSRLRLVQRLRPRRRPPRPRPARPSRRLFLRISSAANIRRRARRWPAGSSIRRSEAVALADYRLRHAAYRSDPDLQRLHASAPMVMMWDDHETRQRQLVRRRRESRSGEGRLLERPQDGGAARLSRMAAGLRQ